MTQTGKHSNVQASRRKMQVSSARNRKSMMRPSMRVAKDMDAEVRFLDDGDDNVEEVQPADQKEMHQESEHRQMMEKTATRDAKKSTKVQASMGELATRPAQKRPRRSIEYRASQPQRIRRFNMDADVSTLAKCVEKMGEMAGEKSALERALSDFDTEYPNAATDVKQAVRLSAPKSRDIYPSSYSRRSAQRGRRIDVQKVNEKMAERKAMEAPAPKIPASEMKKRAIEQAMRSAEKPLCKPRRSENRVNFGFKRVLLALGCAAAAVLAIVYFVNLNAPNVSIKVAAMQSGINASYPSYVPRDYDLSDITSENGKITLNFRNLSTNDAFTIIEETSSWDSTALESNYVKSEYGSDYTLVREQGLALYIGNRGACWVNGGVVYKLKINAGTLTKKQIKAIAVSL